MDVRPRDKKNTSRMDNPAMRARLKSVRRHLGNTVIKDRPYAGTRTTIAQDKSPAKSSEKLTIHEVITPQNNKIKSIKTHPNLPKQSKSKVLRRHAVKKSFISIHPKIHHMPLKRFIAYSSVILVIIVSVSTTLYARDHNQKVEAQIRQKSIRIIDPNKIFVLKYPLY